jgi:hypothetical protein
VSGKDQALRIEGASVFKFGGHTLSVNSEGVCDEMWEVWSGRAGRRGLRLVGTVEKGVYVARTHLCGLFMAVVVVLS